MCRAQEGMLEGVLMRRDRAWAWLLENIQRLGNTNGLAQKPPGIMFCSSIT